MTTLLLAATLAATNILSGATAGKIDPGVIGKVTNIVDTVISRTNAVDFVRAPTLPAYSDEDMLTVLTVLTRRYNDQMQSSPRYRAQMHGEIVKTEVATNATGLLTKTVTYKDGLQWRDYAGSVPVRKPTPSGNLPKRLAEARARRQAERAQGVTTVTQTVNITRPNPPKGSEAE